MMLKEIQLDSDEEVEFALRGADGLGIDGKMIHGDSTIFSNPEHQLISIALP